MRGSGAFKVRHLIASVLEEIPRENFVAIYPEEPRPDQRALLESAGVLVGVSPFVNELAVFTPAEFERFVRDLESVA